MEQIGLKLSLENVQCHICNTDPDSMTFIYELDPYLLKICLQTQLNAFESYRFTNKQAGHTAPKILPSRYADGNNNDFCRVTTTWMSIDR